MMVHPSSIRISRVPTYLLVCLILHEIFAYGTVTLSRCTSQNIPLNLIITHTRLLPVRSPLLGESLLISFPLGTEMFQFPKFAFAPYLFKCKSPRRQGGVPPFGHLWLNARFQLTRAFRRIPRPSSPLTAKASTVCASLLDHITSRTSASSLSSF